MSEEPIERFRRAGIRWAAGGRGQHLVDAAVEALVDGLDSPALRELAGAQAAFADEDAGSFGPEAFGELDLEIPERGCDRAVVEGARLRAQDFVAGEVQPEALAEELYLAWVQTSYGQELDDWSGLGDWYSLIDDGYVQDDRAAVDEAVRRAAEALVRGERIGAAGVGGPFATAPQRPVRRWFRRILRKR